MALLSSLDMPRLLATTPPAPGGWPAALWSALLLLLAPAANADITTSGSVNPSPPVAGADLVVGDEQAGNPSPLGVLQIDAGSTLAVDSLVAGDEEEYFGDVTVTGSGSALSVTDSGASNPALLVGDEGTGFLTISQRGAVSVTSTSGNAVVGRQSTGFGTLIVEDTLSTLAVGEDLIVGDAGIGDLIVRGGALVYYLDQSGSTTVIGAQATGAGTVTVTGERSVLQLGATTTIGAVGSGVLSISNGATADGDNGSAGGVTVGSRGVVELSSGRLITNTLAVSGRVGGDGEVTGAVTVAAGGELHAGPGEELRFVEAVANSGNVTVVGAEGSPAEIEFSAAFTNNATGDVAVADGEVRFVQALANNGALASTSGATGFYGDITNGASGLIAVGGASNATFYDTVDVTAGTLSIAPGSTALFLEDITISPGSALNITINATAAEEGFSAPLQSAGVASLGEPIALTLADDYQPQVGDEIPLVSAAGGVVPLAVNTSSFEPLPDGLAWDLVLGNETVTALVVVDLDPGGNLFNAGDFNRDGFVDAADYTIWRDQFGQQGGGLAADGNGDGDVDAADYAIWKEDFGKPQPSSAAAAPEPSAVCLLLGAVLLLGTLLGTRTRRLRFA